jgi:hypothetical protein
MVAYPRTSKVVEFPDFQQSLIVPGVLLTGAS